MRKNMAPKKKQKKNIKIANKKTVNKKNVNRDNSFTKFPKVITTAAKIPFIFVNVVIENFIKFILKLSVQLLNLIKKIVKLLSRVKEAFFSILFGLLAGAIGAVVVLSYLDLNTQGVTAEYESKIQDSETRISKLKAEIQTNNIRFEKFKNTLNDLKEKLDKTEKSSLNNENIISEYNNKIKELFNITNTTNQNIQTSEEINRNRVLALEQKIQDTSKLLLSSSKSELSDRLYLAKSLVDRLKSGVPYAPQLVALGQEGLDPALLRFAKGGAPTLSDLAARLSVRAGELRDSLKTKSDQTWKDNLKDEISKFVKIKPTNSQNIQKPPSKPSSERKAIDEVNSLEIESRGVLDAWLKEAIAKKNASIAAENILAKTTAALKIKN